MARALALTAGVFAAAGLAGCSPFGGGSAFTCDLDTDCDAKAGGRCEANKLCSYMDPSCMPSGQRYGENAGGNSGRCVGDEQGDDGGIDTPPGLMCFGAANGLVRPCFMSAPTGDVMLQGSLDTDTSPLCKPPQTGGEGYCVIAANNINVADTTAVTGSKPLVLVAVTSISIVGGATLDVASHHTPAKTGAGAGSSDCMAGTPMLPAASGAGGGGAGGAFGGNGGNGGTGNGTAAAGGRPGAMQTPMKLRGGCPGQDGVNGTFGAGGKGGGAVYLIANTSITIAGDINASGEGGHPGTTGSAGGGGGGSGGMIGLDAPMIFNTGVVFANGASGGEGSGVSTPGRLGPEPIGTAPSGIATGGTGNGGDGGTGSGTGALNGGTGSPGAGGAMPGGGGGGGGGIGVIKVYRGSLTGQVSPMPS
jgi:hypothetical protein